MSMVPRGRTVWQVASFTPFSVNQGVGFDIHAVTHSRTPNDPLCLGLCPLGKTATNGPGASASGYDK